MKSQYESVRPSSPVPGICVGSAPNPSVACVSIPTFKSYACGFVVDLPREFITMHWPWAQNSFIPLSTSSFISSADPSLLKSTLQIMSGGNFKSIVNGDSPKGRQQYTLLQSPKSGSAIPLKLPFLVILSLILGLIFGGTWNKMNPPTDPCTQSTRVASSLDDYVLRNQYYANGSLSILSGNTSMTRGDSQLRNSNANSALSIAWLMSFPVSYDTPIK